MSTKWRDELPPNERLNCVNIITEHLKQRPEIASQPADKITQVARKIEHEAYTLSNSRSQYLETISSKVQFIMTQIQQKATAQAPSVSAQLNQNLNNFGAPAQGFNVVNGPGYSAQSGAQHAYAGMAPRSGVTAMPAAQPRQPVTSQLTVPSGTITMELKDGKRFIKLPSGNHSFPVKDLNDVEKLNLLQKLTLLEPALQKAKVTIQSVQAMANMSTIQTTLDKLKLCCMALKVQMELNLSNIFFLDAHGLSKLEPQFFHLFREVNTFLDQNQKSVNVGQLRQQKSQQQQQPNNQMAVDGAPTVVFQKFPSSSTQTSSAEVRQVNGTQVQQVQKAAAVQISKEEPFSQVIAQNPFNAAAPSVPKPVVSPSSLPRQQQTQQTQNNIKASSELKRLRSENPKEYFLSQLKSIEANYDVNTTRRIFDQAFGEAFERFTGTEFLNWPSLRNEQSSAPSKPHVIPLNDFCFWTSLYLEGTETVSVSVSATIPDSGLNEKLQEFMKSETDIVTI